MPQDAFTLKYLSQELNSVFAGGKVNRIVQPDFDRVVFTVYTGKRTEKLLIDVNPSSARIGVTDSEVESPLTAPNFCMLLRKHLLNAEITDISVVGFDRIVKITFLSSAEFKDSTEKVLYAELMGRYSNIILTENKKVLGGNRGINMFDDGVRPLIVGHDYVFPPTQNKKEPNDAGLIEYYKSYTQGGLICHICSGVQGLAKSTVVEMVYRFAQKNGIDVETLTNNFSVYASGFFKFSNEFLFNTKKAPCVNFNGGVVNDVCVFSYDTLGGYNVPYDTLYQAENQYYILKLSTKLFKDKLERISNIINTAVKKAEKRISSILAKEKDALDAESNRLKGELILSNIYRIKQGQKEVELENYYDNMNLVQIALDTNLSPSANAEKYYKKYNKQKRTLMALKPQKEQAESELNYLKSIRTEISSCETLEEVNYVFDEMVEYGLIVKQNKPTNKKLKAVSCNIYSVDGYTIRVGRNNLENDKLTFSSSAESIWLHVKDVHSSHVIIDSLGTEVPEKVLKVAGEICAYYSPCRNDGKAEIVYTKRKNVKKPRGAKPGFVIYDNYLSFTVKPNSNASLLKVN